MAFEQTKKSEGYSIETHGKKQTKRIVKLYSTIMLKLMPFMKLLEISCMKNIFFIQLISRSFMKGINFSMIVEYSFTILFVCFFPWVSIE